MTRIACCQVTPEIADFAANRDLAARALSGAFATGAQVVVLPELVTSGYMFASREEARSVAITVDHPIFAEWAELAAGAGGVIVAGFAELGEDDLVYNSAVVVDGSGVRAVYRKLHLWDTEKLWFTPGELPPPIVDTDHGRVGVVICYDLEFCELTRAMALGGTQILAVPTNWPLAPRPRGEHPGEVVMGMAAARMNRMVIACCDRAGTERGQAFTGGTAIIDENGWVIALPEAERDDRAFAEVEVGRTLVKAISERNDVFADRRPEVYARAVESLSA